MNEMDNWQNLVDGLWATLKAAFLHARPEGWPVILGFIIPVTLLAFVNILLVRRHLSAERKLLKVCKEAVKAIKEKRLVQKEDVKEWLESAPDDSVVSRVVRSIWEVRLTANPDLEAIATMLSQSEAARLGFARNAPNLLLLAGILGTVLGLAGAVGSLGPQIQATLQTTDPIVLTRNLGETLRYMQTAFTCTVWGVTWAIVVAAGTRWVSAKQSELLADVQEFGISEFAPLVLPRGQEIQLEEIRQLLHGSHEFLESTQQIMQQAANRFDQVLNDAGTTMQESLKQLQQVASGMQESLTQVSGDVQSSAESLKHSSDRVKESAEALDEYHRDLRNAYVTLQELFNKSQEELKKQAGDQLKEIEKLQKQFGGAAEKIVGQVDGAAQKLGQATTSFDQAGKKFVESGDKINQRLDGNFQKIAESIDRTLRDHKREMEQVEARLRDIKDQLQEQLRELIKQLDPRLLPQEEWAAVKNALQSCDSALRSCEEALKVCITELRQIQTPDVISNPPTPIPASGDGDQRSDELREALGAIFRSMQDLNTTVENFRQTAANFDQNMSGFRQTLEAQRQHDTSENTELRKVLSQVQHIMTGLESSMTSLKSFLRQERSAPSPRIEPPSPDPQPPLHPEKPLRSLIKWFFGRFKGTDK